MRRYRLLALLLAVVIGVTGSSAAAGPAKRITRCWLTYDLKDVSMGRAMLAAAEDVTLWCNVPFRTASVHCWLFTPAHQPVKEAEMYKDSWVPRRSLSVGRVVYLSLYGPGEYSLSCSSTAFMGPGDYKVIAAGPDRKEVIGRRR